MRAKILSFFLFLICAAQSWGAQGVTWENIGPGGGGWLQAVTVVPAQNGSPRRVYVGCDVGGFYRSDDDGASWQIHNDGLLNYDIRVLAYDPSNPDNVYAGSAGGIYKSVNGGFSWTEKRTGLPAPSGTFTMPIGALALDPGNPSVLYAGTGLWRGGDTPDSRYSDGKIYKSLDAGESWSRVNTGAQAMPAKAVFFRIAVDPVDGRTVYAATDYGLYRSTDAGVNWNGLNSGLPVYHTATSLPYVRNIVIDPANPQNLYAVIISTPGQLPWQGGIYKSTNAGQSWTAANGGITPRVTGAGPLTTNFCHLLIDPSDPRVLYAGDTSWLTAGVYKSTDAAGSWKRMTTGAANIDSYPDGRWTPGGLPNVGCFALDPSLPSVLFYGNAMCLFRSGDSGLTWRQCYAERLGGDAVSGWYWRGRGIETLCGDTMAVDPTDSSKIYFGYHDVGFLKSVDNGVSYKKSNAAVYSNGSGAYPGTADGGGNVFDMVVDPQSPNIIYAANGMWGANHQGCLCKSVDYGESWQLIGQPSNGLPSRYPWQIAIDTSTPVNSRTIYVALASSGIYKSSDGGTSWSACNNGIRTAANMGLTARSIVIDPRNPLVLYAGFAGSGSSDIGGLCRSADGGAGWVRLATATLVNVNEVAVNPADPRVLFAAQRRSYFSSRLYPGGIYKSTDGGATWRQVLGYQQVGCPEQHCYFTSVQVNPLNPNIIYAASMNDNYFDESRGYGVFRSTDCGETWQSVKANLSHLNTYRVRLDPSNPAILYAATHGNGMFRGYDHDVDLLSPVAATVTGATATSLQLSWNRTMAPRYRVYVSSSADFSKSLSLESGAPSLKVDWLLPSVTWYCAVYGISQGQGLSLSSAVVSASTLSGPALSAALAVREKGPHRIVLAWEGGGAERFNVSLSSSPSFLPAVTVSTAATTARWSRLRPGTTYYCAVRGEFGGATSIASATVCAVTDAVPWPVVQAGSSSRVNFDRLVSGTARRASLAFPSNAAPATLYVAASSAPLVSPVKVNPRAIAAALARLQKKCRLVNDTMIEFAPRLWENGDDVTAFNGAVALELPFNDADGDGYVDGSAPRVAVASLKMYVLNEHSGVWEPADNGGAVDTAAKVVRANIPHLSVYALFGASTAEATLDRVQVFPCPYRPGSGTAYDRQGGMVITGLTPQARVRVFTVAGELVADLREEDGDGTLEWQAVNDVGGTLASGVYIYVISGDGQSAHGTFAIER